MPIHSRAFLKRQHRIKLLERNKIVQEELEEDKRVLEEIRSLQAKEDAENDVKEKQSRTEQLQWLKEVHEHRYFDYEGPEKNQSLTISSKIFRIF